MEAKKNYFIWNNKYYCFIFFLSLFITAIHQPHNPKVIEWSFFERIRIEELSIIILSFILFWFSFLRKGAKLGGFYNANPFYCKLMLTTSVFVICFTIHFLNPTNYDINKAVKVWEIASYLITFVYTAWFWYFSENGKTILIALDAIKPLTSKTVFLSVVVLIIITALHSAVIFGHYFLKPEIMDFISNYGGIVAIFLIIGVYFIFNYINVLVINNCTTPETSLFKKEFEITYRYIDRPTLVIFCILLAYALYTLYVGCFHSMEIFFGGAIAFELILSSIIWSNTETV